MIIIYKGKEYYKFENASVTINWSNPTANFCHFQFPPNVLLDIQVNNEIQIKISNKIIATFLIIKIDNINSSKTKHNTSSDAYVNIIGIGYSQLLMSNCTPFYLQENQTLNQILQKFISQSGLKIKTLQSSLGNSIISGTINFDYSDSMFNVIRTYAMTKKCLLLEDINGKLFFDKNNKFPHEKIKLQIKHIKNINDILHSSKQRNIYGFSENKSYKDAQDGDIYLLTKNDTLNVSISDKSLLSNYNTIQKNIEDSNSNYLEICTNNLQYMELGKIFTYEDKKYFVNEIIYLNTRDETSTKIRLMNENYCYI